MVRVWPKGLVSKQGNENFPISTQIFPTAEDLSPSEAFASKVYANGSFDPSSHENLYSVGPTDNNGGSYNLKLKYRAEIEEILVIAYG